MHVIDEGAPEAGEKEPGQQAIQLLDAPRPEPVWNFPAVQLEHDAELLAPAAVE